MPEKTLYIVQQFDKLGRKLVAGRNFSLPTSGDAVARAGRDAGKVAGVVAIQQMVDTDTGEVLEEPIVLARHGELPQEFREE